MRQDSDEYIETTIPFRIRRRVRWSDCDPGGVAFTGSICDYVIDAVMAFYRHIGWGPESQNRSENVGLPCKSTGIVFSKRLNFGDEIALILTVSDIRAHTFDIHVCAYFDDGQTAFEGRFSPICIGSGTAQRVQIPEALRLRLKDFYKHPGDS